MRLGIDCTEALRLLLAALRGRLRYTFLVISRSSGRRFGLVLDGGYLERMGDVVACGV